MIELKYTPLEKLKIGRPVDRIGFIKGLCAKKRILDMGCYDETALSKTESSYWLHGEICSTADEVTGIDNSADLPDAGRKFFDNDYVYKGDVFNFPDIVKNNVRYDIIVAGELIEHLADSLKFLKKVKSEFKGEYLIITTPNATSISNVLLGIFKRESNHKDHYQIYSYKTLNTLLRMSGFEEFEIIPYYVRYTEMIMNARGIKRIAVKFFEKAINILEFIFPLLSGGLIVKAKV